ncbi:dTMP kinase [Acholeplasma sp. OttesenSCG-928-E16]|nr:dTMP kinase [Acholeplasma sp. OttesenSCG-928-E16]
MFITFEGGEGTGKTTIIKTISRRIEELGHKVITTREPGGSIVAEQIRNVILDPNNDSIKAHTEALLYAASRAQHIDEVIKPALEDERIVLCDRYLDSSLAYQGYARGLGYDYVLKVNDYATKFLPDLTFYIDLDPQIGLDRIVNRVQKDRLDLEEVSFHQLVRKGYLDLVNMYPKRIIVLDGTQTIEEIITIVLNKISEIL